MTQTQDMKTRETREVQPQTEPETYLRPTVDIFEDSQGITLMADLPGVSRERLEVRVDGDNLTIEGRAKIDMPEGMEALHADIDTTRFRRSFSLSSELDTEAISATMKDGVLTLTLPRRAELQPRKVEVSVG
jgi:HSP20 family molecular chaperone IbpA